MKKIRQVYDWIFNLANKTHGTRVLLFVPAFESILFSVSPSVLFFSTNNRKLEKKLLSITILFTILRIGGLFIFEVIF